MELYRAGTFLCIFLGQHPVVWQKSYKAVVEMAEIDEPEIQMP